MISHKHKVIFIHIPKCGGTSIEYLFNVAPFDSNVPDYENVVGWCPKRRIYMQHATAFQLLEMGLITQSTWDEYYKFSIVRNPWERALSDYMWMKKNLKITESFKNFINKSGKFARYLNYEDNIKYRGEHLIAQCEYLFIDNKLAIDHICKLENIQEDLVSAFKKINFQFDELPRKNSGINRFGHYSFFYNKNRKQLVADKYNNDIKIFKYTFQDRRIEMDLKDHVNTIWNHLDLKFKLKLFIRSNSLLNDVYTNIKNNILK